MARAIDLPDPTTFTRNDVFAVLCKVCLVVKLTYNIIIRTCVMSWHWLM